MSAEYFDREVGILKGAHVVGVHILDGREVIAFELDSGGIPPAPFIVLGAEGECCSESWFEHLSGSEALRDAVISDIEYADGNDQDSERQDVDRLYFVTFITNKGRATLEMRNASNGYYGGSIYRMDRVPDGLKPVTDDF